MLHDCIDLALRLRVKFLLGLLLIRDLQLVKMLPEVFIIVSNNLLI